MGNFISISDCKKNEIRKINMIENTGEPQVRRLVEMGFVNGEEVVIKAKSFSGQTMLIGVRGSLVSIRKTLAKNIMVAKND